jgi:hypothetical protein
MRGAILPPHNTSSWRGAYLSTGTTLPFTYLTSVYCCKHIFHYDSVRKLLDTLSYLSKFLGENCDF